MTLPVAASRAANRKRGGRGGVFDSIFGAVLVQTTSNGLVMLNANPYLYPLVNSLIIFTAAWVYGRRRL
jgi:ribose transport system permease protein